MRLVVHGAGGIGGVIAARLHQSGHDVVAIARGAHLDAWRANGLRLQTPDEDVVLDVPVVGHPSELKLGADDVVLLTMKSQDTVGALADLPPDVAVVCAQNGVANEREVLRRFERAYGICVMMPTSFTEPGIVQAQSSPITGLLDIGRYPDGVDELAGAVAAALRASTFESVPRLDIMRWKHAKLLMNLGNAVQALCEPGGTKELIERVRAEGVAVLTAAGIPFVSTEEDAARRGDLLTMRPVAGAMRGGGSTWQSFARGTGSIETDHLNGEIVLLGRLHGVPTPVNALVQLLANDAARRRTPPGSMTAGEVLALLS
ncbi:MAG TPA: 2-dehydropantoate 2-reductase N-terminal domain-containing protein [Acidimicrobiales bacterium]|nr:2-dehydropantoate 2-reductase N-terminal domain-containing protein [Acidimicrobiales bacterium]